MRVQGLVIANCLLALACSAPGAANDAVRCANELSCPALQVCYRGFCVESDSPREDAGTLSSSDPLSPVTSPSPEPTASPSAGGPGTQPSGAPVSASPSTQPSATPMHTSPGPQPTVAVFDAGVAANAAGGDADASVGVALPVDRPAAAATPASASAGPVADAMVPAQTPVEGGGTTSPTNSVPMPAQPMRPDAGAPSAMQECLTACAAPRADDKACQQCFEGLYGEKPNKLCGEKANSRMSAVCAAFCAVAPQGQFGCKDSHACHGAACGSD